MIEPAAGVDRSLLAFLSRPTPRRRRRREANGAPTESEDRPGEGRDPPAPPRTASRSSPRGHEELQKRIQAEVRRVGAIGRRYRRQDEIGTPWAVTIDHQSLDDDTVTIRGSDSLVQDRVAIDALAEELERRLGGTLGLAEARRRLTEPARPLGPDRLGANDDRDPHRNDSDARRRLRWTPTWRSPLPAPAPGVLVLMEIFGVGTYIRGATDRLAEHGYVALAPDLYRPDPPRHSGWQGSGGAARRRSRR